MFMWWSWHLPDYHLHFWWIERHREGERQMEGKRPFQIRKYGHAWRTRARIDCHAKLITRPTRKKNYFFAFVCLLCRECTHGVLLFIHGTYCCFQIHVLSVCCTPIWLVAETTHSLPICMFLHTIWINSTTATMTTTTVWMVFFFSE